MPEEIKPVLVLREEVVSDANPRKRYTVSVYSDRTALCACTAFAIQRNKGNLGYMCKHIYRVLGGNAVTIEQRSAQARVEQKRAARVEPVASSPGYAGRRQKHIDL